MLAIICLTTCQSQGAMTDVLFGGGGGTVAPAGGGALAMVPVTSFSWVYGFVW